VSDDTRSRILAAAGAIFADCGFEAATVREICRAAKANLASVNYHFGDKETLYLETIKLAHTLKTQQTPLPPWPPNTAPEEKLRVFVRTMLQRMLGQHDLCWTSRLMTREMLQPTLASKPLVEEFIRPQFDMLLSILDEMLPPATALHRRQKIAFSIIGQCLHYRISGEFVAILIPEDERRAGFSIDDLEEHIVNFSLAALTELARDPAHSWKYTPHGKA